MSPTRKSYRYAIFDNTDILLLRVETGAKSSARTRGRVGKGR